MQLWKHVEWKTNLNKSFLGRQEVVYTLKEWSLLGRSCGEKAQGWVANSPTKISMHKKLILSYEIVVMKKVRVMMVYVER